MLSVWANFSLKWMQMVLCKSTYQQKDTSDGTNVFVIDFFHNNTTASGWWSSMDQSGVVINRYAFSGGQDSIENHRKYGANLEVDIPIKYLGFFLEEDAELEHIRTEYGSGRMLTGEVKKRLIEVLTKLVERDHRARAAVTDEMVDAFMAVRPLPNMFS